MVFNFLWQVAIIGFLLSLTSSCADPAMPSFTKETVVLSVQTIVDGFFETYVISYFLFSIYVHRVIML